MRMRMRMRVRMLMLMLMLVLVLVLMLMLMRRRLRRRMRISRMLHCVLIKATSLMMGLLLCWRSLWHNMLLMRWRTLMSVGHWCKPSLL
jgi:hypothetical protein